MMLIILMTITLMIMITILQAKRKSPMNSSAVPIEESDPVVTMSPSPSLPTLISPTGSIKKDEYYVWPDFVLNLVTQSMPTWASWRKKAEMTISKELGIGRKEAYFNALCEDRIEEVEARSLSRSR